MNPFIIELSDAASYLEHGQATSEMNMTKRENTAVAAMLFGLSALACIALSSPSAAQAGPIVPPGHYCLSYDEGGTDCSFSSYAQCEATASGIAAECYGPQLDERSAAFGWGMQRRPYRHS